MVFAFWKDFVVLPLGSPFHFSLGVSSEEAAVVFGLDEPKREGAATRFVPAGGDSDGALGDSDGAEFKGGVNGALSSVEAVLLDAFGMAKLGAARLGEVVEVLDGELVCGSKLGEALVEFIANGAGASGSKGLPVSTTLFDGNGDGGGGKDASGLLLGNGGKLDAGGKGEDGLSFDGNAGGNTGVLEGAFPEALGAKNPLPDALSVKGAGPPYSTLSPMT